MRGGTRVEVKVTGETNSELLDKISSTSMWDDNTSRVKVLSLNLNANSIYAKKTLPHILEAKSHDVVPMDVL
jgi:hypothetical protein